MILDWDCPLYLQPLSKVLEEMYWTDNKNTRENKTKTNQAISCLTVNMVKQVAYNNPTIQVPRNPGPYSAPLIYNGNRVKRKVSRRAMVRVMDWMDDIGLVTMKKGGVVSWHNKGIPGEKKETECTTLRFSEYLVDLIKPYSNKVELRTAQSVIELRDKDGKVVPKRLGDYQKLVKEIIDSYNVLARSSTVSMRGTEYAIQLKKIYNEDFNRGGRLYLIDDSRLYSEALRRENRGELLLDGEETIELDYKHLHMSLICEMEGIILPEDFDPYQISLEGFSGKGARWAGKLAALVLINAGVGKRGIGGLVRAMKEHRKFGDLRNNGDIPSGVMKYRDIFDAVLERNEYLLPHSLEPIGMVLQNKDGMMVDGVIAELNFIDEICLPIHDSFIVKQKLKDFTLDKMQKAYLAVMGSDHNCRIEEK